MSIRQQLKLLKYAVPYRWRLLQLAGWMVLASLIATLQPWPMKVVVDNVLGADPLPVGVQDALGRLGLSASPLVLLALGAGGSLVVYLLGSAVDVANTWGWTRMGRRLVFDLAQTIFARSLRRSLSFHARTPVGDLMSRVTGDSWCVYQMVDSLGFAMVQALLTTAMMLWLMFQLDSSLAMVAMVTAPLTVGASLLVGKPLHLAAKLRREVEGRLQGHVQQTLTGIPVVQAFCQEARGQRQLEAYANDAIRAQQRTALLSNLNTLSSGLVMTLGSGVVLWFGAHHVLDGSLSVGSLLVFLVYLTSLQAQTRQLAGAYSTLRTTGASSERVIEVLDVAPEVSNPPGAPKLSRPKGHLVMEDVTFGYEAGVPILRDICLEAHPGQTIALVGPTGAGKSTLVHLIPRFFDPWQGSIRLDGRDVRDVQLESVRAQISLVLQEPFLFPLTVAENIGIGRPGASRGDIEDAARRADADAFIRRLPKGYDTIIGERGGTLSGGERQRLSIARAMLKNAPILILDEPTSALDAGTEQSILESLRRFRESRTTFVVAHRLSTVRAADCILVLRDGLIVESGRHEQLMRAEGLYARLQTIHESRADGRMEGTA